MEQTSELVSLGQLIHELSYSNETKSIIFNNVNFDFIKKGDKIIISEIKKSKKLDIAGKWQLLYYLYILKQKNIKAQGIIRYPKLRKIEKIELTPDDEEKIKHILREIKKIISSLEPPDAIKKTYCKSCSYYELCFA